MIYESQYYNPNYLSHHGVKGMKWGVRKYQNPDGTLTAEGKKRYYDKYDKLYDRYNSVEGMRRQENKRSWATYLGTAAAYTAAVLTGASMPITALSMAGGALGGAGVSNAKKVIDTKK